MFSHLNPLFNILPEHMCVCVCVYDICQDWASIGTWFRLNNRDEI